MDKEHHDHNHHHSSGFMNGLVMGLLLGGGAVFLLGTKRGKKLLKVISEEGLEGMSGLGELLENKFDYIKDMDEEDLEEEMLEAKENNKNEKSSEEAPKSLHSKAKRFFKGVHKKKSS